MKRLQGRLIQDKRGFIYAILGLILLMILTIPYPHSYTVWEWILKSIGIHLEFKIGNRFTLILTGLPILILLFLCLRLLYRSLREARLSICIIMAMVTLSLPSQLVTAYQSTIAMGIYSLDVKEPYASCDVTAGDGVWNGTCSISIENYSSTPVRANLLLKMHEHSEKWTALQNIDLGEHLINPGPQQLEVPIAIPYDDAFRYSFVNVGYYDVILSDDRNKRQFLQL